MQYKISSRESSAEEPKLLDLYMRGRADRYYKQLLLSFSLSLFISLSFSRLSLSLSHS